MAVKKCLEKFCVMTLSVCLVLNGPCVVFNTLWALQRVLLISYLCIFVPFLSLFPVLATVPRVLAPPQLGYEGRMHGKEMRTEESKDEHWNILDHSSVTSKHHQLR